MSVGDRLGTSATQDYVLLGVLGLAAYIVYQLIQGVRATGAAVGAVYSGAKTVTAPVASALAKAWSAMTLAPSPMVLGNVLFPDGSRVPLSSLTVKQDSLGNVYVASPDNGLLLQLQPSNANGDWPAVQITDPSQIGTAMSSDPDLDFGVTNSQGWS